MAEHVGNGDFEDGTTTNWSNGAGISSLASTTSNPDTGARAMAATWNGSSQSGARYTGLPSLVNGTQYIASARIRINDASFGSSFVGIRIAGMSGVTLNNITNENASTGTVGSYQSVSVTFTPGADVTGEIQINADSGTPANGKTCNIDNVSLQEVGGATKRRYSLSLAGAG